LQVHLSGGSGGTAEYTAGEWTAALADECVTWRTSMLDDALVPMLFECVQRLSATAFFHVELLFTLVDCELT
jgi:hypothetical protein